MADARLIDFDRCSGVFSNYMVFPTSNLYASIGVCFSPNSQYLYVSTVHNLFQINTIVSNPIIDTVAVNDGNYSPIAPFQTDFYSMYLANDGRIYITSNT